MTVEGKMNKEWLDELASASDDELIEKLRLFSCDPYFYDLFDPLVEEIQKRLNKAEPVRRGRWKRTNAYSNIIFCDVCGEPFEKSNASDKWNCNSSDMWNYCPHCGAKMEED